MGYSKEPISFTLRGIRYTLSVDQILSSMRGVRPERIKKYYVKIGSENYPPKQVISETLGISRISFTTMDAYDILRRLGFSVEEED